VIVGKADSSTITFFNQSISFYAPEFKIPMVFNYSLSFISQVNLPDVRLESLDSVKVSGQRDIY